MDIENLPKSLILDILDLAESFAGVSGQPVKKVPLLRGKTIVNLFFEASTRTRNSFELAAKKLSADIQSFSPSSSSLSKGETHIDTATTYSAMGADILIIRHSSSHITFEIAKKLDA